MRPNSRMAHFFDYWGCCILLQPLRCLAAAIIVVRTADTAAAVICAARDKDNNNYNPDPLRIISVVTEEHTLQPPFR